MSSPATIGGVSPRVFALRVGLAAATVLGMLASVKLWLHDRAFPLMPVAPWFPQPAGPWDVVLFLALLLALPASIWFHRASVIFFLLGALFLYGGDQNRGQPWFYLYYVLLLLTLWPPATALAAARVVISAVYVWAAVQKFGPQYQELVVPYLTQPLAKWLPPAGVTAGKWLLAAAPLVELFIGVGLWLRVLRRAALVTAVIVHGGALLLLGPLGHGYNLVVWPWNLAMIALVFVLFPPTRLMDTLREVKNSWSATLVVALVTLLPALSFLGRWDSYFSFALYSGNTATADLIITPSLVPRLPEPMRRFAHPLHEDVLAASPGLRGLLVFDMQSWCQAELGVPPIPEPRAYRVIGQAVARHAVEPTDAQLLIKPRRGPVQALRANDLR